MTKVRSLQLWFDLEEEEDLPTLLTLDTLRMIEYLSGFQPRYVKVTGYVLSCAVTQRLHPVIELMMTAKDHETRQTGFM